MCGVIVVDACKSQCTCLGCDVYIHDHSLEYRHNYMLFYQLPNSNLFTHCMLFYRKKPLVNKTHLFTLTSNDTYMSCPLLSLGLSTARSNPLQSTSSHGKINQSSWPNQTNKSEKKYEAITIMHKRVQRRIRG